MEEEEQEDLCIRCRLKKLSIQFTGKVVNCDGSARQFYGIHEDEDDYYYILMNEVGVFSLVSCVLNIECELERYDFPEYDARRLQDENIRDDTAGLDKLCLCCEGLTF